MTSASGRQTKSLLGGPQLASLSVTGTKVLATNGLDTEEWTPRYGGPRQYTHTKQPFPEQVANARCGVENSSSHCLSQNLRCIIPGRKRPIYSAPKSPRRYRLQPKELEQPHLQLPFCHCPAMTSTGGTLYTQHHRTWEQRDQAKDLAPDLSHKNHNSFFVTPLHIPQNAHRLLATTEIPRLLKGKQEDIQTFLLPPGQDSPHIIHHECCLLGNY